MKSLARKLLEKFSDINEASQSTEIKWRNTLDKIAHDRSRQFDGDEWFKFKKKIINIAKKMLADPSFSPEKETVSGVANWNLRGDNDQSSIASQVRYYASILFQLLNINYPKEYY